MSTAGRIINDVRDLFKSESSKSSNKVMLKTYKTTDALPFTEDGRDRNNQAPMSLRRKKRAAPPPPPSALDVTPSLHSQVDLDLRKIERELSEEGEQRLNAQMASRVLPRSPGNKHPNNNFKEVKLAAYALNGHNQENINKSVNTRGEAFTAKQSAFCESSGDSAYDNSSSSSDYAEIGSVLYNSRDKDLFNRSEKQERLSSSGVDTDDNTTTPPKARSRVTSEEEMLGVTTRPTLDDSQDEDECTLEFGEEEEENVHENHALVFREYHGEDYSQYLKDEDAGVANGRQFRKGKRTKGKPVKSKGSTERRSRSAHPEIQEDGGKKSLRVKLKDAISNTLSRAQGKKLAQMNAMSNNSSLSSASIHSFSFTDSKMGNAIQPSDIENNVFKTMLFDSTESGSWGKDTLTARSLRKNVDMQVKHPRSASTPRDALRDNADSDMGSSSTSRGRERARKKGLWQKFSNKLGKNDVPELEPSLNDDVSRYADVRL